MQLFSKKRNISVDEDCLQFDWVKKTGWRKDSYDNFSFEEFKDSARYLLKVAEKNGIAYDEANALYCIDGAGTSIFEEPGAENAWVTCDLEDLTPEIWDESYGVQFYIKKDNGMWFDLIYYPYKPNVLSFYEQGLDVDEKKMIAESFARGMGKYDVKDGYSH